MNTANVADVVNDCAYVLSFLDAAIGTFPKRDEITLHYEASTGLALILCGISQRLFASADALSNKQTEMEVC